VKIRLEAQYAYQNLTKKYFNFVYLFNFFSYLDILFSLDNDTFDYRNVDLLNKLDHKKIHIFYLFKQNLKTE